MDETHVVTCFLRHRGEVLLLRRSEAVGSYPGTWGGVAGHAEGDPSAAALEEIGEETGLDGEVTLVRAGEPFPVEDEALETRWLVHPFLFDVASRDVTTNEETDAYEWVPATEILRRETVPYLWTSYERVAPTVETVADDREHGSAYVSVRALDVLRDRAGLLAEREPDESWAELAALASELLDARPSMTVVENRVNRVMAEAVSDATASATETAAIEEIERAVTADDDAAATAAERLGAHVLTLSRSGTVLEALARSSPETVTVATSEPGGEGVGVAETLAARGIDVTLITDATVAWYLCEHEVDTVLVGADAILPDGRVVNKVGTRGAALAADREAVDVLVVAASDKISADDAVDLEDWDPSDVYDGDPAIRVDSPLFDVTDANLIDGVCTDAGVLDGEDVRELAAEYAALSGWLSQDPTTVDGYLPPGGGDESYPL
jgi:translation initiation factor 2B subunit (eIF-2B alpha/beta/delta family)